MRDIIQVGYGESALPRIFQEVDTFFAEYPILPTADSLFADDPALSNTTTLAHFLEPFAFVFSRLATVKHDAFVEEREWRAIVSRINDSPRREINFRVGNRLVPYLNLRFDPSAVSWIYIGPGGGRHDKRALRAFLTENGYDLDRVRIEHSDAPYRGD